MTLRLSPPSRLRASARVFAVAAVLLALVVPPAAAAPTSPAAPPSSSSTTGAAGDDSVGTPPPTNATFGLQPVTNGRIDSRNAFTYQTGPGGAYQDSFAVVNYSPQPVTLQVYAADLGNNADGGLVVGDAEDPGDGASRWIRLPDGLGSVDLPAASAQGPAITQIPFAWAVPTSAAAGDHTAALVASLSVTSTGQDGQPVRLDQRVALRVFFRVSGSIDAELAVTDFRIRYSGTWDPTGSGTAEVSYTLTNTGNVRLGATQTLTTSAWLGHGGTPGRIADQPLLLPGSSVRVTDTIRDVFPGIRVSAHLHVDPVRAADDVNVSPRAVDTDARTWAFPWALIVAFLLALLLFGCVVAWWRRRQRRRPASKHGRGRGGPPAGGGGPPGPDGGPTGPLEPALSRGGAR